MFIYYIDMSIRGFFMCGIAGFCNPYETYEDKKEHYGTILENMQQKLRRRGPDDQGLYIGTHAAMAHVRLSVIDLTTGHQPMTRLCGAHRVTITYNGELYNWRELKQELIEKGCGFETTSDTEVVLNGFLTYGPEFVKRMNGIFAFAVYDEREEVCYLFRDRSGIKPLFYTTQGETLIFSSEIKGLLAYPGVEAVLDKKGLNEVFSIGPAKTYGCGVFRGIEELLPGHWLSYSKRGMEQFCYWKLESKAHEDSYEETIEKTSYLLTDAVKRQMVSDVPICTFLSGGVDSSLVSAICANELKKEGKQLHTFSFDFTGNDKNFHASSFQPAQDRPYVDKMVEFLGSEHHYLECDHQTQADYLYASIDARDLPAMADVDSSLLYFCSEVAKSFKVAMTGECADEIFGGYPWFHKKECFEAQTFPWTMDLEPRKSMLSDAFLAELQMDAYVQETYETSVAETPKLAGESKEEARRREIAYLNQKWFMQTLLDRMDRTSMYSGLEARVPFADYRIIEYLWNVPWEMKAKDGVVKALLREAGRGILPDEILFRKKSPYPKTYDRKYEALLVERLRDIMQEQSAPIRQFLNAKKVERFLQSPSDYGKPWYGQLMAAPQMIAYLIQVNYWLLTYNIKIEL